MGRKVAFKSAPAAACTLSALLVSATVFGQLEPVEDQSEGGVTVPARLMGPATRLSGYATNGSTPIRHEVVKLTASDAAAGDFFGNSVSVSGNVAIVGATGDDCASGDACGSAYVFRFDGTDWIEEQRLIASDAAEGDIFGRSVSISGNAAIVGAAGDDCLHGENCGAAYIFRFDGDSWIEEQKLTALKRRSRHYFGSSVALSGEAAVVGTPDAYCPTSTFNCGSASFFRFDGNAWVHERTLTASDAWDGDMFGISVSLSGDLAVAGSWQDACASGRACGSAYVFRFDGTDWVEQQKLTASDVFRDDLFGLSASASGGRAVVGAHWDDCDSVCCSPTTEPGCVDPEIEACVCAIDSSCCETRWSDLCAFYAYSYCETCGGNCGSAYVFRFNGSDWVEEAKLTASDAAPDDWFGESVAMNGRWVVSAAPGLSALHGDPIAGTAYAYRFNGDSWVEAYKLTGSDTKAGDDFGSDVSVSGGTAIVGASRDDCGMGDDCGSAYVFRLTGPSDMDVDGDVDLIDYSMFLGQYEGDPLDFILFHSEFTGP